MPLCGVSEFEIRPPWAARVYVAVFSSVWCAVVASAGVRAAVAGSVSALVILPMLCLGAALGYRLFRLEVRAERETLTIRNTWSTRTLTRADIEGFRTGVLTVGSLTGGQVVQVLMRDETVLPLDVTRSTFPLPRSRSRLQERLQHLRAWHTG